MDKASIINYQDKELLRLTSSALEWKKKDYLFRSVTLCSNRHFIMGRVVWISYNPCEIKDGVVFPKLLM